MKIFYYLTDNPRNNNKSNCVYAMNAYLVEILAKQCEIFQ